MVIEEHLDIFTVGFSFYQNSESLAPFMDLKSMKLQPFQTHSCHITRNHMRKNHQQEDQSVQSSQCICIQRFRRYSR